MLALTATQKGGILLAISAIAAPIAGYLFHRSAQTWSSFGKGPFSINARRLRQAVPGCRPHRWIR